MDKKYKFLVKSLFNGIGPSMGENELLFKFRILISFQNPLRISNMKFLKIVTDIWEDLEFPKTWKPPVYLSSCSQINYMKIGGRMDVLIST